MKNDNLMILNLISKQYLLGSCGKEPKEKLKLKLHRYDLITILKKLEEYEKTSDDYQLLCDYTLFRFYNYNTSLWLEKELAKFSYIRRINSFKPLSKVDIKIDFGKYRTSYDVKLTRFPCCLNISNDEFVNINDDSNLEKRKELYKYLKDNEKIKSYDNKLFFLIKSKSKDKIKELETKCNESLLKEVINNYFSDKEKLEKLVNNFNEKVIFIPILID